MAKNSGLNLGLSAFDDLFETDESRADLARERLMDISVTDIQDFPDHPYQVKDDESMMELVESIKEKGLINPVMVRPLEDGKYEMIAGHRRKRACEIAGIETVKARVTDVSRDEAVLLMVDSNLQREEILPSEKAAAYKMRLDAMKRLPGRPSKENCSPVATNYSKPRSAEILSNAVGESKDQIFRYIRLNELTPELLTLVDDKKIALRPAVEISYLPKETQKWLVDAIELADATPSHAQTIKMRKFHEEGKLTQEVIESIMDEEKPNQREKPAFRDKRITNLIPKTVPVERQCDYVIKALECYNRFLERKRNQPDR